MALAARTHEDGETWYGYGEGVSSGWRETCLNNGVLCAIAECAPGEAAASKPQLQVLARSSTLSPPSHYFPPICGMNTELAHPPSRNMVGLCSALSGAHRRLPQFISNRPNLSARRL